MSYPTRAGAAATAAPEFTAVAHRGDPYVHRENTLASLGSALRAGAGAVEADVRLTRDGVPVLLHDTTLERLWGRTRLLDSLSAGELDELTGGGVPTLREALALFEDGGATAPAPRLFVDLPDPAATEAAVAEVHASGAAGRVYYCGGPTAMLAVRRADPDAEIALTWTTLVPPRAELLAAVRPRWMNYRFGLVSPELVARDHAAGMLVSAWTADTRFTMRRLLAAGVDAITTNRIDALRSLLPR
ncbi:glycerophosphodiester phosphodiesterase [Streptomyces albireticuli]|uniref:Glycerophosphodiester phosphodiesterase n=1 Tax=Streptomyces albireticuli TaxID=1940 RepID=A0A2A2D9T8_9ACTN|nr:glycerophosphodiester phosphodiesterase [Streptomyces albireticuli]MCD9144040.1 glycerophosphodiester phosphodiesterase [Streptomyces albireticuli]MCD9162317.1 glycerophosphodiester phosphodiesterase [Streptomyces albireticuli]MCD9195514.1 glycerophosphodiester phosphodiesterase [Streptomyces albireticuli]PAU48196.1 glycerophosphodiester phosphodiesterase [Streptomyces albireticuli]